MRASCLAFCISRLLGESIWRRNSTSKGAASKRRSQRRSTPFFSTLLKPRFQAGREASARSGIAVDLFVPVVGHVFQARVGNEPRELVPDGEIVSNKRGAFDALEGERVQSRPP